ncbi:TetR/AcrR family transcriptional regulator C-terminal domain-containing protein [Streptomyces actinomycinicus]|uniref:TetR/AcrR family transcriptional regulator C-terminal domain-containing protein n=1 Tax=Streptomyces actinomycinicus TaxID=1695166 RepID=A0A937EDE8_9ACTN|nr:TetR/AcrR family transcriptional regulator [Streptomyces actinomycinicus]MBL1080857.1 TetR/AcrR family transcriptional regulator C-terminal domain-containing protein [Streptomyces actinomycinicus]
MPQPPAPRRTAGRPARISREEIIRTASRIVSEDGVDRLTMRRLATEVGSTPMALYHHVRDKEELLVLLLDDYADRSLHRPEPPPADPRERILTAAVAIHDVLAACPWIVEVLTADDLLSASALWFVEQIVAGLADCGLTLEQAVHGYRAIWYFTAGEILVRATSARRRATDDRPTYRDRVFAGLDPAELPHLSRIAPRWAPLTAQDTYEQGLRALLDGLLDQAPG